jgi:hypothetical protein
MLLCVLLPGQASGQSREQLYQEGADALYNLYFSTAKERFRKLTALEPDDPSHWTSVASALWLEIVAGQEKLNMESFAGASLGTNDSKDTVSAEDEAELRKAIAAATSIADAALARNSKDIRALFAKGAAKGILAAFEAVVKRSYVKAYSNAREARDLHEKVLTLNPNFKDAKLTIGLYQYTIGAVPWLLRTLLFLRGGDKEEGLMAVADVARNGGRVRTDAKMLLVVISNREKQYQNSLALVSDLHASYPKHYLLELSKAALYSRLGQGVQALATYANILAKIETRRDGYERLEAPKVLLLQAKAYLDHSQPERGIAAYERVISDSRASDTDRANAHLWLGKLNDVSGRRTQSLPHYDAILALNCRDELKQEAQKYRKKPFAW